MCKYFNDEKLGLVFIYYDEFNRDPSFSFPHAYFDDSQNEISDKAVSYSRINLGHFKFPIDSFVENGFDNSHFMQVHKYDYIPKIGHIQFEKDSYNCVMDARVKVLGQHYTSNIVIDGFGIGLGMFKTKIPGFTVYVISSF